MSRLQRRAGILILLGLLCSVGMVSAQDSSGVTVVGSGIVLPAFESLVTASGAPITLDPTVTGTNGGFERFCAGEADISLANRTISSVENNACTTTNVEFVEQLIAHQVIAFIAKADAAFTQCLTADNVNAIFAPSAGGQVTNWNQVDANNPDIPLSVIVPDITSPTFAVLDDVIRGDGVRTDATIQASDEATIRATAADPGAIGVVNFSSVTEAGDQIKVLELDTNTIVGCTAPSTSNVEARSYTAANSQYVYINNASLDQAGVKDAFLYISSTEAVSTLNELGLTAPSVTVYATNIASLQGEGEAAPFSAEETSYQIPFDVAGNVAVAGAVSGQEYLSNLATQFQGIYASVTVDVKTLGQPAGIRRLCNGEIDIAITDRPLNNEQAQNCDANNITTLPIELSKQVVVLVANENSPFLTCLTPEQIATTWIASSRETITNWNQVESSFPDQEITLFQPNLGDSYADILLTEASGNVVPTRDDTEVNNDPLYRAAATANVEGALTFMSWPEYQNVLANNQERIQLVGVDNGDDCVTPSAESISDGSYPLTRSVTLLVNQSSLAKPQVQSLLWFLAIDENYPAFEQAGLIGVSFGSLQPLRENLQKAYLQAEQTAAEATPEPVAEATAEATSEATPAS